MEEKKKSILPILIFVFIGCLLFGAGIGNAFDAIETDAGATMGMGIGFISIGIIWLKSRNK